MSTANWPGGGFLFQSRNSRWLNIKPHPPAIHCVLKRASPPWKQTRIGLCLPRKTTRFNQTKATRLTLMHWRLTIWSIRLSMASTVFVHTQNPVSFPNAKFTSLYNEHLTRLRQQRRMGGSWRGWLGRTQPGCIQDYKKCCYVLLN